MRRARNGPDCWVLEAKNQNALISISFVSQIQSFYHSLQLIHSSSKLKNRRGQDERHCLFDVCSVGRLVVLSLSMSLLILNQEVVIQFFIGQNSQNLICMYHTLSPYIIRNHQKYIAAWTNCPTNWEAIMSQRFLPLFLSRRANGLAYSSISPTHQRFMVQKTNAPLFPFQTKTWNYLWTDIYPVISIFNHTKTWNYCSKDTMFHDFRFQPIQKHEIIDQKDIHITFILWFSFSATQ